MLGLPDEERVSLCRGATSTGPAQCATSKLLRNLSPFARVAFCKDAAGDWSDSAKCMKAAPPKLSDMQKVVLCKGAKSTAPAKCAEALRFTKLENGLKVELCSSAEVSGSSAGDVTNTAECYKKAPAHLTPQYRVKLCQNAVSIAPALCAALLKGSQWRKVVSNTNTNADRNK